LALSVPFEVQTLFFGSFREEIDPDKAKSVYEALDHVQKIA